MWRLLEFEPEWLDQLLLMLVDQSAWGDATRTPRFPGH